MNRTRTILAYVLLSSSIAVLLGIIVWSSSSSTIDLPYSDKALVAFAFMASCLLGIMLSAKPGFLRHKRKSPSPAPPALEARPHYDAHHPDCGHFEERVFSVRGRRYCGGCLGLMLGSTLAFFLMVAYLLAINLDEGQGDLAFIIGIVVVALCLLDIAMKGSKWSHLLSNIVLVLGFFLVTVGVLGATGSVAYGLLAIVACFLWLDTRIQISDWRHARTCDSCGRGCGFY